MLSCGGFGSLTICVLCYGDNLQLAERFLQALYKNTDPAAFRLRAGLNEVCSTTSSLFSEYQRIHGNIDIFFEPKNIFKSPMMRRMFSNPSISTDWIVWFDDDSYPTRSDWLQRLMLQIQRAPHVAQWGEGHILWNRDTNTRMFIETAQWYCGKPIRNGLDSERVESMEFAFMTGGFWAIKTEVLRALNWPDPRLIQANDDFLLGEALRQNGYECRQFSRGVHVNTHARRNAQAWEINHLPPIAT